MRKLIVTLGIATALGASAWAVAPTTAYASDSSNSSGSIKCHMKFSLHGWSIIYKTASGKGFVTCSNGQSMRVMISIKGGGLTVGKSTINNGRGTFSGVTDIKDILGGYAAAAAHAGAVKSSGAMALTKGPVSLALSGTGKGWDLGVDFSAFTISPLKK